MKKNVMMRLACFLLVAVLISTSAISGTYAKYVTADSGSDSARVAKFGVEVTVEDSIFAEKYKTDDTTATFEGNYSVASTEKVVAPGTKGELAAIEITGQPEVAVEVTYGATVELEGWVYNDGTTDHFYCPLVIKVNTTEIDGADYYDNKATMVADITDAINGYSKQYAPNTILTNQDPDELTITWEWPFVTEIGGNNCDVMDTYLGDQAADGNAATVEIGLTCTVTQID